MKTLVPVLLAFLLFNCENNTADYQHIYGEWVCSSWIIESTGSDRCNDNVYFKFNADKTYSSTIDNHEDSGVYKLANGLLYSTPKGKLKIGVEIKTLNADTLQFIMSRSGEKEVLTLAKME